MEDIVRKYKLNTHLMRKYIDTNKEVLENHLNSENIELLGYIIERIKNQNTNG